MNPYKTRVIELFGLPRTGKTSTSKGLLKWFQDQGFRVLIIHERVARSNGISKLDPLYNYDTAKAFMEKYKWADKHGYDYVIVDRGLLDALVWIEALRMINPNNPLQSEYRKEINDFALQVKILHAFFFKANVITALVRDGIQDFNKSSGTIMNVKVLNAYLQAFENIKCELKLVHRNIVQLDTTDISLGETFRFVTKKIFIQKELVSILTKSKTNSKNYRAVRRRRYTHNNKYYV